MGQIIKWLEKIVSILASLAMAGIVVIVFINVVMRYIFNTGLTWSDEVSVDLFVWFIFLGGILAQLYGLHLKVDVFTAKMPKKLQKVCAFISYIFVIISMLILFFGGIEQVKITQNNISSATGIPSSYITVSMVVFAAAVIILTIYDILQLLRGNDKIDSSQTTKMIDDSASKK